MSARSARFTILLALFLVTPAVAQERQPPITHTAIIETSKGTISMELYGKDAPRTVANFVALARNGFYNGLLIHRVVPGFVIQMGDQLTRDSSMRERWGTGGMSSYDGKPFEDELDETTPSYERGYVEGALAMANRGPNTNSSQFFIMLEDRDDMPHKYTIFGRVTRGMDVVHTISKAEANKKGVPAEDIQVRSVTVAEAAGQ